MAVEPSVLRCGLLAVTAWRCGRFGDAPPSTKRAFYQPRTVRERGKCARSHNWWGRVLLWLAPQRLSSLGLLLSTRGPELHPALAVCGYSHRAAQTSVWVSRPCVRVCMLFGVHCHHPLVLLSPLQATLEDVRFEAVRVHPKRRPSPLEMPICRSMRVRASDRECRRRMHAVWRVQ